MLSLFLNQLTFRFFLTNEYWSSLVSMNIHGIFDGWTLMRDHRYGDGDGDDNSHHDQNQNLSGCIFYRSGEKIKPFCYIDQPNSNHTAWILNGKEVSPTKVTRRLKRTSSQSEILALRDSAFFKKIFTIGPYSKKPLWIWTLLRKNFNHGF